MINNHISYFGMSIYLLCTNAIADHPTVAFSIDSAGSINTISADPLPSGAFAVGIQTEVIDNDEFSTEQLENYAGSSLEGVHSVDRITNTSISISYGITEDLSINARLPYIERNNIQEGEIEDGEAETHTHGDSSGFGDILILGQYRISQSKNTNVSVNFGMKLPTGETNNKDKDDVRFETEFQPGSGSWDFLFGVAVSKQSGLFGYNANILFNKTTKGAQSTEIGDAISYNVALSYRLNRHSRASHDHSHSHDGETQWDIMLELNGQKRDKNKISGNSEKHSGGNTILLSPGVRVSSGNLGGFLSVGIPVVENQNGTQADIGNRILAGISLGF